MLDWSEGGRKDVDESRYLYEEEEVMTLMEAYYYYLSNQIRLDLMSQVFPYVRYFEFIPVYD